MTTYAYQFRPSQYTATLLQVIEQQCAGRTMTSVLDIGVGSGVLLAALAKLGAQQLWGVDISEAAVQSSERLLALTQSNIPRRLLIGDMWDPLPVEQDFDVILANLPHFPAQVSERDRPPGWTGGDGRRLINRFIEALPKRLARSGVAYFTHHDLVGYSDTIRLFESLGLEYRSVLEWTVFESPERMAALPPEVLAKNGQGLRSYGDYAFANSRILEVFAKW
jgi:release factor glutamine methyltransferase